LNLIPDATADTTLQTNIDNEESARISADTTLQTNIDNEESARISADTTLQTNIDNEESARISADTTLQTNIDDEETARIAGDNALTTYVDNSIINLIDGAGIAYDTLLELKNEIQANDTELNDVFIQVATKVSKAGDTMTGNLTVSNPNEIYYKGQTLDARFHSLTTDYYTEAESDTRFVNIADTETITGAKTFTQDVKILTGTETSSYLRLEETNNYGGFLKYNGSANNIEIGSNFNSVENTYLRGARDGQNLKLLTNSLTKYEQTTNGEQPHS
jgi:hypothetical protein